MNYLLLGSEILLIVMGIALVPARSELRICRSRRCARTIRRIMDLARESPGVAPETHHLTSRPGIARSFVDSYRSSPPFGPDRSQRWDYQRAGGRRGGL